MDGRALFDELKRTLAYRLTAPEKVKREILLSVLDEYADSFKKKFDKTGIDGEDIGFGYLVEAFAKHSRVLPKNTAVGERIEKVILGTLRTGMSALIKTDRPLRNPDFLWLECAGTRIEIYGLGEVKSSFTAYQQKPEQLLQQEDSIRHVLQAIQKGKERGTAHSYFAKRKVILREPFRKVLIVPAGKAAAFMHHLPKGWECKEIEFGYEELLFVAKRLWPEFWYKTPFEDGFLGRYEKEFLHLLFAWGTGKLEYVFADSKIPISFTDLLLFCLLTQKLPLVEEDNQEVSTLVKESKGPLWHYPEATINEDQIHAKQVSLYEKLTGQFGKDERMKNFILLFIQNFRLVQKNFNRLVEKNPVIQKKIEAMDTFDIFR